MIRLEPRNAQAFHGRGSVWNGKDAYDKAIADYTEAIRLLECPDTPYFGIETREHLMREAYYCRSEAYFESGDQDKGRADDMQCERLTTFGQLNPARIIG